MSCRLGIMTSWKTSHGPQKSITTAPSEIRNATGIGSLSGGFSELVFVGAAAMKIATGTSSASVVKIACLELDRAFMTQIIK
jgi:hypothetical protein